MWQIVGGVFFSSIVLFVVASQILSLADCFVARIRRSLIARLMPDWRFFAPRPVTGGRHILIETAAGWKEVWSASPGGRLSIIWNPQRRSSACVYQAEAIMINDHLAGDRISQSEGLHILIRAATDLAACNSLVAKRGAVALSLSTSRRDQKAYELVAAFNLGYE